MELTIDNVGLIELHDARLRSLRWAWDGIAVVEIAEAYLYVLASAAAVAEDVSYDIYNADLELTCEGVSELAAQGGAFSRHDSIYSCELRDNGERVELESIVLARAAADAIDIVFFPTGTLAVDCRAVRGRFTSERTLVGRWPGRLEDEHVRPEFFNRAAPSRSRR